MSNGSNFLNQNAYINGKRVSSVNDDALKPSLSPQPPRRMPVHRRPVSSAFSSKQPTSTNNYAPPLTRPSLQERSSSGNLAARTSVATGRPTSPSTFDFESLRPPASSSDLQDISPVSTSDYYEAMEEFPTDRDESPDISNASVIKPEHHPLPITPATDSHEHGVQHRDYSTSQSGGYDDAYEQQIQEMFETTTQYPSQKVNPFAVPSDDIERESRRENQTAMHYPYSNAQGTPIDTFDPSYVANIPSDISYDMYQKPVAPLNPEKRALQAESSAQSSKVMPVTSNSSAPLNPTVSSVSAAPSTSTSTSVSSAPKTSSQTSLPKSSASFVSSTTGRASTDSNSVKEKQPQLHKDLGIGTGSVYVKTLRKRSSTVYSDVSSKSWNLPIGIANKGRASGGSYSAFAPSKNYLRRAMDIKHSHLTPRLLASEVDEEEEEDAMRTNIGGDIIRTNSNTNLVNHGSKPFRSSLDQMDEDVKEQDSYVPHPISKPASIRRDSDESIESIEENIGRIRLFVANPDSD